MLHSFAVFEGSLEHSWLYRFCQEPMSRSMQLNYIPVTAFSSTDLFLDRIYFEWDSGGSAITNNKTLIDVTASLDRNYLSFTKEKVY